MKKQAFYGDYPFGVICLSMLLTVLSFALGTFIFYLLNVWIGLAYFLLCMASILVGVIFRCRFCYYHGKRCYSGLGRLAGVLVHKGDSREFTNPEKIIPPLISGIMVLFLPVIGGVILLAMDFSILLLVLFILYLLIAVVSSFAMRKKLCRYCRQGKLGCRAYEGMRGK